MKKVLVALLLLIATAAQADNTISSVTTTTFASLTSVAIKAIVKGDDDSSAVLRLFHRWYGIDAKFDTGMVMVRRVGFGTGGDAAAGNVYEGRILWMTPGRTAEWYIEYVDGGSTQRTPTQTVECAGVRPIVATGQSYYLNQATGNNANTGFSPAQAKKSFNTDATGTGALAALLTADQPGTGIFIVGPLHAHEKLVINSGTDGYQHFIMGDGTNRDSVIICGANALGEVGKKDATNNIVWESYGFNIWRTHLPGGATSYGDSIGSVTLGFGEWLHRKTSIDAMVYDSTGALGSFIVAPAGEKSGWLWRNDSLYVKRRTLDAPASTNVHIGYLGALIEVGRRNWHISGITVRYAGGPSPCAGAPGVTACEDPPNANYEGIVFGRNANSSGGVVDSCSFYGNSGHSVYFRYTSPGLVADSCTVSNCVADGLTIGSMDYLASKSRIDENAGTIGAVGMASNVYKNVIREVANGIQAGPVAGSQVDSTWALNNEIAYNNITRYNDDGIELDTTHGINLLILGNRTFGGSSGLSHTDMYHGGPVFVVENQFLRWRSAGIKIGGAGDGSVALCRLYQNTFASDVIPTAATNSRAFEGRSGGNVDNVTAWNNIFMASTSSSQGPVSGPFAQANTTNQFNYNLLFGPFPGSVAYWNNTLYTLATWRATGMENNGLFANPYLYRISERNAQPERGSPAVGAGRRITGVNTSLSGLRYLTLPHIGAVGCSTCGFPR